MKDFFGPGAKVSERKKIRPIALWLMGRRKRVLLDKEMEEIADIVKTNLKDTTYVKNLVQPLVQPIE